MEKTLKGEIKELGYPKAALFSFCVALLSYNVMSTIKAALFCSKLVTAPPSSHCPSKIHAGPASTPTVLAKSIRPAVLATQRHMEASSSDPARRPF